MLLFLSQPCHPTHEGCGPQKVPFPNFFSFNPSIQLSLSCIFGLSVVFERRPICCVVVIVSARSGCSNTDLLGTVLPGSEGPEAALQRNEGRRQSPTRKLAAVPNAHGAVCVDSPACPLHCSERSPSDVGTAGGASRLGRGVQRCPLS